MLEQQKQNVKENKFVLAPEERVALIEAKIERANARLATMLVQIEAVKRIKQNSK
jgi:hypothetical protein